MIKNTDIVVQNYGSSLYVYTKGANDQEAYNLWLDGFNFGMTGTLGSEPEYVADGVIAFWTTKAKLLQYWFTRFSFGLADLLPDDSRIKGGQSMEARKLVKVEAEARAMDQKEYEGIVWETYRSVNSKADDCEIEAEDPYAVLEKETSQEDLNHKDACTFAAYAPKEA